MGHHFFREFADYYHSRIPLLFRSTNPEIVLRFDQSRRLPSGKSALALVRHIRLYVRLDDWYHQSQSHDENLNDSDWPFDPGNDEDYDWNDSRIYPRITSDLEKWMTRKESGRPTPEFVRQRQKVPEHRTALEEQLDTYEQNVELNEDELKRFRNDLDRAREENSSSDDQYYQDKRYEQAITKLSAAFAHCAKLELEHIIQGLFAKYQNGSIDVPLEIKHMIYAHLIDTDALIQVPQLKEAQEPVAAEVEYQVEDDKSPALPKSWILDPSVVGKRMASEVAEYSCSTSVLSIRSTRPAILRSIADHRLSSGKRTLDVVRRIRLYIRIDDWMVRAATNKNDAVEDWFHPEDDPTYRWRENDIYQGVASDIKRWSDLNLNNLTQVEIAIVHDFDEWWSKLLREDDARIYQNVLEAIKPFYYKLKALKKTVDVRFVEYECGREERANWMLDDAETDWKLRTNQKQPTPLYVGPDGPLPKHREMLLKSWKSRNEEEQKAQVSENNKGKVGWIHGIHYNRTTFRRCDCDRCTAVDRFDHYSKPAPDPEYY
ncbi:hypothetical protein BDV96DRAFT_636823 [Lophiotrema nucula]|uniref:Uncharacterized protein n=1 Tax=Lophiotrema nucula TaxID=690887 RepID=A0A6A5YQ88_9PLEO|nr:hypothetical protein BDV96DRAFT_636823 [Lophiotrema nucula]